MSTITAPALHFEVDADHEAHEPLEESGARRDDGLLLVSPGAGDPVDTSFRSLGDFLAAGDLVVVNTSATIAAALDGRLADGEPIVVHLSGAMPGGVWLVEPRQPRHGSTAPLHLEHPTAIELFGGGSVQLLTRFADSERLWLASLDVGPSVLEYAAANGRPIRYRHVRGDWPLACYQTVFAREPGSAEMPSASRPFTAGLVTDLVTRGVLFAPLVLHTGVSSLEGGEQPYPEQYRVPGPTASLVNAVRDEGGRVVAAGTTVARALATVTDERGIVHPGAGWTDVVVTPEHPVASVDGLLTGWHEPESTHLMMLEAFADPAVLQRAYDAALAAGYRWHEFGDTHLILQDRDRR